jgi:hypothetical protein
MSRELPEFPNLEHLKKQAKARLRELQQREPAAKLTDAQLAVAREYGFASWMKLKNHIETLPQPASGSGGRGADTVNVAASSDPGPGLFVRFTMRARRLIFFARYFAGQRSSHLIEVEHLLLGLLEEDRDRIRGLFPAPVDFGHIPGGEKKEGPNEPRSIPLSENCRQMLQRAAAEADALGHSFISTGHFWLAFLQREDVPAVAVLIEVLKQNGISPDKARKEIIASLADGK